jgi:Uma2 family endonuclease
MTVIPLEKEAEPILIDGLTWREFKVVEQLIERPGVRLSFLDGVLEIRKMPGKKHETIKKRIAALLEIYLEFLGLDFTPTGSMTLESESGRVKREADESYELSPDRERPDLAIEVVVTSGGIDKLEVYKRLKITEVWFWEKGQLSLYALGDERHKNTLQSQLLPHLEVALLMRCINLPNHAQALGEFRQGIQS